jgi:membrane protease YdiL (CAAX protease family)
LITWAVLIPGLAHLSDDSLFPIFIIAAFGPFLAAILVVWIYSGRTALVSWLKKIFKLRISIWLYVTGIFIIPIVIGLLHFTLYRILGGEPDFSKAIPWYFYLLYLIPTALLTGGNEEPGWRGFALPGLLKWFHPIMAALILGLIHGAWHLPLMNHYNTTFTWYLFNIIPLTFLLNWFYLKSQRCIIPVMMFHGGTNVIGSFIPASMDVLNGFGSFMVLRGIVYWGLAIVLIIFTKGRLGYQKIK